MIECFLVPVCVVLAALVISGIRQEDDASTTGPHGNDRFASGPNVKDKSVRRTNMKDNSASGKRVKYTSKRFQKNLEYLLQLQKRYMGQLTSMTMLVSVLIWATMTSHKNELRQRKF